MPRIRTIKPSFFSSLDVAALPYTARITFAGLWTYADDAGRGIDDARLIKSALWPLDDRHTVRKVERDMDAIAGQGLIVRWESDGRRYFQVTGWHHQKINKPSGSNIEPPPEVTSGSGSATGAGTERSAQERKGKEEEGRVNQSVGSSTAVAPTSKPPGSVVAIAKGTASVLERAAVLAPPRRPLVDSEREALWACVDEALRAGVDGEELATAIAESPFRTPKGVRGQLGKRGERSRSVGDRGLDPTAEWLRSRGAS